MRLPRYLIVLFLFFGFTQSATPTLASDTKEIQVDNDSDKTSNQSTEEGEPLIVRVLFYTLAGLILVAAVSITLTFVKKMQRKKQEREARKKD